MNEKEYLYFPDLIAELLNTSLADALQFLNKVHDILVSRPAYDHFYFALKALPEKERTQEKVAGKLVELYSYKLIHTPEVIHHPKTQVIETNIVGVTYCGRQAIVVKLKVGDAVILRREPTNPYDCNAIMVLRTNGEQIGYINRFLAATLASKFDDVGKTVQGVVTSLTYGRSIFSSIWPNIRFSVPA
jgi:HIRAN domain